MSSKKKAVTTPLHLLHQLSQSLLEHLESACTQALVEAEKLQAKLEKQHGKAQEKLHKARTALQDAADAGKAKAQQKARKLTWEIEEALDTLKARQVQTLNYIHQLKLDTAESLRLAQGIGKVKEATGKSLEKRANPPVSRKAVTAATPKAAVKPAKAPVATQSGSAKPVAAKPLSKKAAPAKATAAKAAAAKPSATKPAATRAKPAAKPATAAAAKATPVTKASAPAAKPAAKRAPRKAVAQPQADASTQPASAKPAAVKPAARKPAAPRTRKAPAAVNASAVAPIVAPQAGETPAAG